MSENNVLIKYDELRKNICISQDNETDCIVKGDKLFLSVDLIEKAFRITTKIDRRRLAKLICGATQKTNYACDKICKHEGSCVHCLVMAEHILNQG